MTIHKVAMSLLSAHMALKSLKELKGSEGGLDEAPNIQSLSVAKKENE